QMGLRELLYDEHALARWDRAEQALEPRHGLRRLTALEVEAGERAQRGRGRRQRDHPAVAADRAIDLPGLLLRDRRVAPPQLCGRVDLAVRLEALGLRFEQVGELAVLALVRQQVRDRLDRGVVAGTVLEVRAQGVEPATALLDDADRAGELEA